MGDSPPFHIHPLGAEALRAARLSYFATSSDRSASSLVAASAASSFISAAALTALPFVLAAAHPSAALAAPHAAATKVPTAFREARDDHDVERPSHERLS